MRKNFHSIFHTAILLFLVGIGTWAIVSANKWHKLMKKFEKTGIDSDFSIVNRDTDSGKVVIILGSNVESKGGKKFVEWPEGSIRVYNIDSLQIPNGEMNEWDKQMHLKVKGFYKYGKRDSLWTFYGSNGKKKIDKWYFMDKPMGGTFEYGENGLVKKYLLTGHDSTIYLAVTYNDKQEPVKVLGEPAFIAIGYYDEGNIPWPLTSDTFCIGDRIRVFVFQSTGPHAMFRIRNSEDPFALVGEKIRDGLYIKDISFDSIGTITFKTEYVLISPSKNPYWRGMWTDFHVINCDKMRFTVIPELPVILTSNLQ